MLTVHRLSKSFDLQTLFENVSFSLNPQHRIGLVGPNGCGKTTLMRILAGLEQPSSGYVSRDVDLRVGYLPQSFEPDPDASVGTVIGRAVGSAAALEDELAEAAAALAERPDDRMYQARYDDLLHRIQAAETGRSAEIVAGLRLDGIDQNLLVGRLSGGQKTRLSLALVLLGDPQLLLLDEPTNHLDIAMLEWLEAWLSACPCAALIISHDRTFLDHAVTGILEMDPNQHSVRAYTGNFSAYLAQRQAEIEQQWSAYRDQQAEIRHMQQDVARVKAQAAYTERQASSIRIGGGDFKIKGYKSYQQGIAKKVAKKAKAREKKLERYQESDERVEKPRSTWHMRMEFNRLEHVSRSVIHLENLSIGYAPAKPLLQELTLDVQANQRVVITGPNGSGKTTLLRTIAGHIPPLAGEVRLGANVRLGYMTQDQSGLDLQKTALETMIDYFPSQTEARNFLAFYLLTGDEPLKPNSLLSFGQRTRLALARLVAEGSNCLLLDEPINHLDIPSRAQFERALSQFNGAVLAVVHDRYFIERFADRVWRVEDGSIR
ncbi:MAG TPA: ABC-F family ATP-binding cassette domain-containing protein [Anaerolineales bacterium]|nr:ABC-F family ATP-binding cassette domain-containing protein [Anaerolineales bacterium]